jgi:hypothetical protein
MYTINKRYPDSFEAHRYMPQLPSNRKFGVLFSGVLALLAGYGAYHGTERMVVYGWLGAAVLVGLVTFAFPGMLTPFNKTWFWLGELLGKVVSPVVLSIFFFMLITPIGMVARWFGRDELRLKKRLVSSYWINRSPPGPAADSFKLQF